MQKQGPLEIIYGHEDRTNRAYGSRSHSKQNSDRSDIVRDGKLLDTLDRRGDEHMYYSSSGSDKHHYRHRYQPYRRNDRGYLPLNSRNQNHLILMEM